MKNQTAYLTGPRRIEIRDSAMPAVGDDDVLVRIDRVTICGSDAHFFADPTFSGAFDPEKILPLVLGHECSGIVEQAGANVRHLVPGDRVAIEPGDGCGKCSYCLEGHYNLCRSMNFMAAYPFRRGALSRYVAHPAKLAFKLPDNMDTLEGALNEPLAVGMHAVNRSGAKLGKSAAVLGCGAIGLMTIASLKAMGVDEIIAADLFPNRLENARRMGAASVIDSSKQDLIQEVLRRTDGLGANFVFETAGSQKTASMSIDLVAPGGKIVMVGNIYGETPFRFLAANDKEVDILSVFRYVNIYPMAIKAVASGRIGIRHMISEIFPFEKTQDAFCRAVDAKAEVIKVAIKL
jgi:L-iditol 2-dehydrogenase